MFHCIQTSARNNLSEQAHTLHGESLASAGLSVGKDGSIESFQDTLNQLMHRLIIDILLLGAEENKNNYVSTVKALKDVTNKCIENKAFPTLLFIFAIRELYV
jgi:hypothetical protein